MRFPAPLEEVVLLRRYKRFLADVRRADGQEITVHCANPGAMTGCLPIDGRAWISDSGNPKRKLRHSLELVRVGEAMISVNTARANAVVREGLEAGVVPELAGFDTIEPEAKWGESRIDFRLGFGARRCFVEVKSVTLGLGGGLSRFPDAVSARGSRHLRALMAAVDAGHRAALVFCSSRDDTRRVGVAADIDPTYAATFEQAVEHGVEVYAHRCEVSPAGIWLRERVPLEG